MALIFRPHQPTDYKCSVYAIYLFIYLLISKLSLTLTLFISLVNIHLFIRSSIHPSIIAVVHLINICLFYLFICLFGKLN